MTELATLVVQVDTTKAEQELKDFGNQAERTGNQAEKTALKTKGIGQSAKSNVAPMRNMNYMARNVSYQLQDVAVQASMGTDSLRILSQQGPQLLSVFGTSGAIAGVVVGVGAAVAGMLAPALMSGKDATEQLTGALESADDILQKSGISVTGLTQKYKDLYKENKDLAELTLATSLYKIRESAKDAADEVVKLTEGMRTFVDNVPLFQELMGDDAALEAAFRLKEYAETLGLTAEEVTGLSNRIDELDLSDKGSIETFTLYLNSLRDATSENSKEFVGLVNKLLPIISTNLEAIDSADGLTRALNGEEIGVNKLVTSLMDEYAQLVLNREELLRLQFTRREITQATYDQANATLTLITAEEARQEQAKVAAKEKEDQLKTLTRLESETDKVIETAQKRQDSFNEKQERSETRAAEASARTVEQYQARLNAITMTKDELDEYNISQLRVSDADRETIKNMQDQISANDELLASKQTTHQALLSFSDNLLLNESKNAQAAGRIAANLYDDEKRENAGKIITRTYTAAAGAMESLSRIPIIGPALGAAAAATIIAAGYSFAAKSLAGRALGGQVRQGESYVVGERGPEVLTMGGSRGFVTPNDKLRSKTVNNQGNVANVTFNINANDTQGFDDLLNKRRGQIVSIINQALNNNGRSALT